MFNSLKVKETKEKMIQKGRRKSDSLVLQLVFELFEFMSQNFLPDTWVEQDQKWKEFQSSGQHVKDKYPL